MPLVSSSSSSQSQIHSKEMFLARKASILFLYSFYTKTATELRCFPCKFTVSASLNTIAAAATASGSAVQGAVSSAITQLAVTAVAIASGAVFPLRLTSVVPGEVVIICWPHGDIMISRTGSTAARRAGLEGNLVLVNGQLVLPSAELKGGDVVKVRSLY